MQGVIDRLEGDRAVVRLEDGQDIVWPTDRLPEGAGAGSVVTVTLASEQDATASRSARARDVLNEIFRGGEPPQST